MIDDTGAQQILKRMYHCSVRYSYAGVLMIMLNSVLDGMIISHFLGGQAAAAFGLILPVYSLISLMPTLLRYSVQTRIGEYIGRGDIKAARHSLFVMMTAGVGAAAVLFAMLSIMRSATLQILTAGAEHSAGVLSMASEYMLFHSLSILPIMLTAVLHPVMQLDGDIRRSPRAVQAAAAVNIAGDLINVLVLHGGMAGMAIATDLSCLAELFILLMHYRRKNCVLRPAWFRNTAYCCSTLFSGGLPFMFRELTAFISGILLNRIAFSLAGETGVSVLCIGSTLWLFLLPAAVAVSSTGTALGSIERGESDQRGINMVLRMGIWYSFIPGIGLAALFFAAAGPMAAFCSGSDSTGMAMTAAFLRYTALALPFTMLCQAAGAHLIVIGKERISAIVNILEGGAVLAAMSWILGTGLGISGMWAARPAAALAVALINLLIIKTVKKTSGNDEGSEICEIEKSVHTNQEVIRFSEEVHAFCLRSGMDRRLSCLAALCVEELACNTLQWGYDGKKSSGADIRIVYDKDHLTLRFRDSGRVFDPLLYTQQFTVSEKDPVKNVGLRIVSGLAADMKYSCVADCNIVLLTI